MSIDSRWLLFVLLTLPFAVTTPGQQSSTTVPPPGKIYLDVVVAPKTGEPVGGLQQQDFTLLDNKVPRPLASFQAFTASDAPVEVLLVIDAVNIGYNRVAFVRDEIDKFLRADGGRLPFPTALAVSTDTGTQLQNQLTRDGNALSADLDHYTVALRDLNRSAGFWGATERYQYSLQALQELATHEASRPGRKLILWISPGWPILSGPEVLLDSKDQQQIFANIVSFSNLLQQGRITLYSVDPLGLNDFGNRTFFWQAFTKGISKPSQTDMGDLALEVLATQSGGLALNINNNVTALLQQCLADTTAYYELSFDPALGDQPNEYHHLEVKVDKPGVTARTRQGYYASSTSVVADPKIHVTPRH